MKNLKLLVIFSCTKILASQEILETNTYIPDEDQEFLYLIENTIQKLNEKIESQEMELGIILPEETKRELLQKRINRLLKIAASKGYEFSVQYLINKGADVNSTDSVGQTPLHATTSPKIIDILLKNNAYIDAQDIYGDTPLHSAAKRTSMETIKALLDKGASVNIQNKAGNTPLHLLIRLVAPSLFDLKHTYDYPDYQKGLDIIKLLLEKGADKNIKNNNQETAIDIAKQDKDNPEKFNILKESWFSWLW